MKAQIINVIAIFLIIICTASMTVNIMTVRPAKPIATEHFITHGSRSLIDMNEWIKQKIREGFIVKAVSFSVGSTSAGGIVVMEKY